MIKLRQKHRQEESYKLLKHKDSDSDEEETELFVRNKPQRIEFPTVEKVIEEGDTLQSLAIKYHCPIAELKRINNIHKENEIFAKRVIKVPHRPFTSALASVHISGNSSPDLPAVPPVGMLIDIDSVNLKLTESISSASKDEVNEIIFNSQIAQKPNDRLSPDIENACDEEVSLLPQNTVIETDSIMSRLSCSGADADISWKVLMGCTVILILALPLIYVFYIAEHPESYQHQHGS
ncbi:lysM and putative peptidoglycan-binding domain-containing protein 3 [Diabrotica undecimpunctata]|uniref:lysM and putative peptidoglycan-binding domain-containing protein 3 n=1 Tax=Diabrotica undecimpunctata TaxID=50387 RepID=UPI003B631D53